MAEIFFPAQGAFVGGQQPYAGHKTVLSAEAVPVNNPPWSHLGRLAVAAAIVVAAWQPSDPAPALIQKLVPIAAPVAAQPRPLAQPMVADQAPPLPVLPEQLVPIPPAVNNPPFVHPARLPVAQEVVRTWEPGPPLPALEPAMVWPSATVNNPPFSHRGRLAATQAVIDVWRVADPMPALGQKLLQGAAAVFQVPFVNLPPVYIVPPDPLPVLPQKLLAGLSVDNPPRFRALDVSRAWIVEHRLPDPGRKTPPIPPPEVDNPPVLGTSRATLAAVTQVWHTDYLLAETGVKVVLALNAGVPEFTAQSSRVFASQGAARAFGSQATRT